MHQENNYPQLAVFLSPYLSEKFENTHFDHPFVSIINLTLSHLANFLLVHICNARTTIIDNSSRSAGAQQLFSSGKVAT